MEDTQVQPFTPGNDASQTLQAQHTMANDNPTDVNNNAILARVQGQLSARIGEEFHAASARRTILADRSLSGP